MSNNMININNELEKNKSKYFTKPFIIFYIIIVFLFLNIQYFYYLYILFISGIDIFTKDISVITSIKNQVFNYIPYLNIGTIINSFGIICGSYLGFETVFKVTKSLNMEKNMFYVDDSKESFFRILIFLYIILFIEASVMNIIIGKFFDVAYNEVLFWFSFMVAEYVFSRKSNKVAANICLSHSSEVTNIENNATDIQERTFNEK